MKRNILRLGMSGIVLALSIVFICCASNPASTPTTNPTPTTPPVELPSIDYSRIGPDDSAIIVYPDPELRKDILEVILDPGNRTTGEMFDRKPTQIQVPNGTYSIYVNARKSLGGGNFRKMPFDIALDNVAITYKIRLATDEEKTDAGIGTGYVVYTLEEVSQTKLR